MNPSRIRSRVALFVLACVIALQMSPGLAAGRPSIQVTFTKWVTDWPNMAGLVSGDVGGGMFAGEVLNYTPTPAIDRVEALYHLNGGTHQMTAHVFVTQNNLTGTALLRGVITDGRLKGTKVRGGYQVIAPCGVINAQTGDLGDVCFQGTLEIGPASED